METPKDSHTWDPARLVDGMCASQARAIAAIEDAAGAIAAAMADMTARLADGGRLIFAGAGTSGRIAAQDAAELPPTFNWPRDRAVVLIAGGPEALIAPVERAEDDADAARADVADQSPGPSDVFIGVAASGTTPYTRAACAAARAAGALTIGICNVPGAPLAAEVDHAIVLDTGAEFVHGSTRLAAGTAQKIALNMLSTGAMIRLGRVYGGHMIDMPPTNAKLTVRARRIVAEIGGIDEARAGRVLDAAGGVVKTAIAMARLGVDRAEAEARLTAAGGVLARVLD